MGVTRVIVCTLVAGGCGRFAFDDSPGDAAGSVDAPPAPDAGPAVALTCDVPVGLGGAGVGAAIAAAGDVVIMVTRRSGRIVDVARWRVASGIATPDGHATLDMAPGPLHAATNGGTTIVAADDLTIAHAEVIALDAALAAGPTLAIDVDVSRLALDAEGAYAIGRDTNDLGAYIFIDVFAAGQRVGGDVVGTDWAELGLTPIDAGTYVMHTHVGGPTCDLALVDPWPALGPTVAWGTAASGCHGVDAAGGSSSYLAVHALGDVDPVLSSTTISRDLIQVGVPHPLAAGSGPRLAGAAGTGFVLAYIDPSGALAGMTLDANGTQVGPVRPGPDAPTSYAAASIGVVYTTGTEVGVVRVCP